MQEQDLLTFIIPVGQYHEHIAHRAIASARTQARSRVIVIHDDYGRGAGWARNRGLELVETPYVTFLDADDWLEADFATKTLALAQKSGRYVYTDWQRDGQTIETPACAWVRGTWHCVTSVIPTAWARAAMFDETLPGGEDTEFFLHLLALGYCGVRLPEPLFHYSRDGLRGHQYVHSAEHDSIRAEFIRKYGGVEMACCGSQDKTASIPVGARMQGDVLVSPTWVGNRSQVGTVTRRMYPRSSRVNTVWIDPRDLEAAPALWRKVETTAIPAAKVAEPKEQPTEAQQDGNVLQVRYTGDTGMRDAMIREMGYKRAVPAATEEHPYTPDVVALLEAVNPVSTPPAPPAEEAKPAPKKRRSRSKKAS